MLFVWQFDHGSWAHRFLVLIYLILGKTQWKQVYLINHLCFKHSTVFILHVSCCCTNKRKLLFCSLPIKKKNERQCVFNWFPSASCVLLCVFPFFSHPAGPHGECACSQSTELSATRIMNSSVDKCKLLFSLLSLFPCFIIKPYFHVEVQHRLVCRD